MKNSNSQLKQRNKTIQVEISLDQIASNLHSMFNPDEKHSTIVVDAIIDNLEKSHRGLSQLFSTMNGYKPTLNYELGDNVYTTHKDYTYQLIDDTYQNKYVEIGECKVVDIDIAAVKQLQVEWVYTNRDGELEVMKTWVSVEDTSKVFVEE